MKITGINEMAASGSTGAGSIAANLNASEHRSNRHADREWRSQAIAQKGVREPEPSRTAQIRAQLQRAAELKKKRAGLKSFIARHLLRRDLGECMAVSFSKLDEAVAMDVNDTLSKLKGLENRNAPDARDTVTYGVEDEDGNIMKITVKNDQADSFEQTLALSLGELEDQQVFGYDRNTSMSLAELLYNLKNEFDIVDVEFPEIPQDMIYNADKATAAPASTDVQSNQPPSMNSDMDGDMMGMDDMGDGSSPGGMDDMGGDLGNSPDMTGMNGEPGADGEMPDDLDADIGEDMPADEEMPPSEDSMFQGLIKMFTAQADAERAKADAEAEKARALQAEYSAKSAEFETNKQEELARMDAELEAQKKKSKEAKRVSDLAKYRIRNTPGKAIEPTQFEGYTSFLNAAIGKNPLVENGSNDGMLDSEQMIANKKREATQKYSPNQNDTPDVQNYKRQMLQLTMTQLNAELKMTRLTKQYNMKSNQNQNPQQNNNQQSGNGVAPSVAT